MNEKQWQELPDFNKWFHTDPNDMIDMLLNDVLGEELEEEYHRESISLECIQ